MTDGPYATGRVCGVWGYGLVWPALAIEPAPTLSLETGSLTGQKASESLLSPPQPHGGHSKQGFLYGCYMGAGNQNRVPVLVQKGAVSSASDSGEYFFQIYLILCV